MKKIDLIYIGPLGYSGSTILDRILGEHPNLLNLGEVMFYDEWKYNDFLCGCGAKFTKCEFWNEVNNHLPMNFRLEGKVRSKKFNLLYLKPRNFYNKSIQMGKNSYDLFSNLIKITGDNSSKIVDSSKVPGRLSMLASSGFFNIYVIHLIRNGKQVCGSMKVRKKMPSRDKEDFTKPMPVWKSAIRWYFSNKTFIKVCKEYSLPVITIKYEDLVDKYDAIKHDLFSFLQLESNDYAHHANRHTISGSHWKWIDEGRFQSDIPKEKYTLNKFEKICFNLIAGRMYKKYGYK